MAALEVMVGLLLAQAGTVVTAEASSSQGANGTEWVDVGYEALRDGRPADAIATIRANRTIEAEDPAALINLGSAHARLGNRQRAEGFYKAAILSRTRYDLQLADGRWLDSRRAARRALAVLEKGEVLALR